MCKKGKMNFLKPRHKWTHFALYIVFKMFIQSQNDLNESKKYQFKINLYVNIFPLQIWSQMVDSEIVRKWTA